MGCFLFASIVTYGFDFDALKINDGMSLWTYILNLLAPHRWLGLATVIIFVRGCIFVWLEWIEQSWSVLKKFRAFIISVILFLILILISIYF